MDKASAEDEKVTVMRAFVARRPKNGKQRRGATVVEFAIVGPVLILLLIGFSVLTMGVFRYQQVAYLARQGGRYASTHGAQYRVDNGLPSGDSTVWSSDVRDNGVLPWTASIDPEALTTAISWSAGNNKANAANPASGSTSTIDNSVTVTVTYDWLPEGFLSGPIQLTSTVTMPMHY
jgi:Flp pilus assembly protein TadG